MPFQRPDGGFRFNFGGMKTNTAADEMPPTKYPFAQNVRYVKSLQTRPGYEILFATALLIETDCPLPNGEVGFAYTDTLNGAGGVLPYVWTINSGSLPAGLSLSAAGVITGTPTLAGASSFVIKLTDNVLGTILKSCSMTIAAAVAITTACPLADGEIGAAYDEQFAATGGTLPYTWSIVSGALPAGLSMDSDGEVTGTPTGAEVAVFTVRVTDAIGGFAQKSCQITVAAAVCVFSDDFVRANGPINVGQPLWNAQGYNMPVIVSNKVELGPNSAGAFVPSCQNMASSYARLTYQSVSGFGFAVSGPVVCHTGSLGLFENYYMGGSGNDFSSGSDALFIRKVVNGAPTILAQSAGLARITGATQEIRAVITATEVTLTYLQNGIVMLTAVDSTGTRLGPGQVGMATAVYDGVRKTLFTDFVGGEL